MIQYRKNKNYSIEAFTFSDINKIDEYVKSALESKAAATEYIDIVDISYTSTVFEGEISYTAFVHYAKLKKLYN